MPNRNFGDGFASTFGQGLKIGSEIRAAHPKISKTGKSGRSQKSSADTSKEYSGVDDGMSAGGSFKGGSANYDEGSDE